MLILLPPSEGKSSPDSGPGLALDELAFPALAPVRDDLLGTLMSLCRRRPRDAAEVLGLGPTQADEVGRNARLASAPCAPAIEVYSGVLFEALNATTLTSASRRRLASRVAIASALFGLLRPDDLIPSYRFSAGTRLPCRPSLRQSWRDPVSAEIAATARGSIVLDLRSSAYADLAPLTPSEHAVIGRISQDRGGRRIAVSHHNKATKGHLVRALVECTRAPRTPQELLAVCLGAGLDARLEQPGGGRVDA